MIVFTCCFLKSCLAPCLYFWVILFSLLLVKPRYYYLNFFWISCANVSVVIKSHLSIFIPQIHWIFHDMVQPYSRWASLSLKKLFGGRKKPFKIEVSGGLSKLFSQKSVYLINSPQKSETESFETIVNNTWKNLRLAASDVFHMSTQSIKFF